SLPICRVGIYEVMTVTAEIRTALMEQGASTSMLAEIAESQCMGRLREDGMMKVRWGRWGSDRGSVRGRARRTARSDIALARQIAPTSVIEAIQTAAATRSTTA